MKYFKILVYLIFLLVFVPKTYAVWGQQPSGSNIVYQVSIKIGSWTFSLIDDSWNLNIWVDESNTNQVVPEGQLFTYNNNYYISIDNNYNPFYHGLPTEPNNQWAYVSVELEWRPNTNYRVNSVVTREGKYYIANSVYNTTNWFINDPKDTFNNPWSEWREIEPISSSHFSPLLNTTLVDYANPDFNYIIYK